MKKNRGFLALLMLPVLLLASGCAEENEEMLSEKPAVYLYPEKAEEVSVWLDYEGELTCTYPEYGDGWHVIARPDGTLQNLKDGSKQAVQAKIFNAKKIDHCRPHQKRQQ